jgi:hypothetical protein
VRLNYISENSRLNIIYKKYSSKIKIYYILKMPMKRNYKKNNNKKRNYKKNNNKVTTRKAYNKNYKKQTAKILQPIAEGRKLGFSRTLSAKFLGPSADPTIENWNVVVPESWDNMYRENFLDTLAGQPSSVGFTGKTLFSRFLNQQIKIRFNTISHYTQPVDLHVCYGWMKIPYVTPLQSIGSAAATNTNGVLIAHNRREQISRSLSKMYSVMFPITDPKQFKMLYNKEFQVRGTTVEGLDPDDPSLPAVNRIVRKDLDYKISWTPNTKYHMRPATHGDGNNANPPPGNELRPDDGFTNFKVATPPDTASYWTPSAKNNGDLWTPFFAIQVKNASTYGRDEEGNSCMECYPNLFQQNKHYFYDL